MVRIASTVLVVALLAATAAAFALTQGLKLQKSPIFGTRGAARLLARLRVRPETARIAFKLRKSSRLDVSIVDGGEVVRTIEQGVGYPKGPVEIEWDGRDDAGRSCRRASTCRGSMSTTAARRSRCRIRSGST